jgi:hypothetical protein
MSSIESLASTQMVSNLQVAAQARQSAAGAGAIEKPAPPPQAPLAQPAAASPVQEQADSYQGRAAQDAVQGRNEPRPNPNSTFSLLA